MFLSRSEYDRGVNTFSPEGRLFQVEVSAHLAFIVSVSHAAIHGELREDEGGKTDTRAVPPCERGEFRNVRSMLSKPSS